MLIEANTKSYERAMVRLQAQTEKAIRGSQRSIQSLDSSLASATRSAQAFGKVLGISLGIGAFKQLASAMADTVHSAAALVDLADKIGITTDALQELRYQAEQNGSSAEALDAALSQFSKRVGEAAAGSGELLKVFQANGIALRDAAGNLRPLNELLAEYADLIANAANDQDRAVLATRAFGKAGDEMSSVLRGGSAEMRSMAGEAHRLNQVIGEDGVRSLEAFDDELSRLEGAWATAWAQMTVLALQALEKIGQAEHFILDPVLDMLGVLKAAGVPGPGAVGGGQKIGQGTIDKRINQAFEDAGENIPKIKVPLKPRPTSVPAAGGSAGAHHAAAKAIKAHTDAAADLIKELERELSLIGKSETEQRVSNALRQAGAEATAAQKQRIEQLVPQIVAQQKAYDDLIDRLDTIRDAAGSALDAFAQSIQAGEGPLKALKAALEDVLQTIIRIAEEQAILRLFGASGTAGGGILGPIINAVTGKAAPALSTPAAANSNQAVAVHVTASPLFHVSIAKSSRDAEERAVSRGPAVARGNSLRYATP